MKISGLLVSSVGVAQNFLTSLKCDMQLNNSTEILSNRLFEITKLSWNYLVLLTSYPIESFA